MVKRLDDKKLNDELVEEAVEEVTEEAAAEKPKMPKKAKGEKKEKTKALAPDERRCLPAVMTPKQAVDAKMKQVRGSFFGKPMVYAEIVSQKNVMIPYYLLEFHLHIDRKTALKNMTKDADVKIIFDTNEQHPMQFDEIEEGELQFTRTFGDTIEREILKNKCPLSEMLRISEDFVQRKYARRFYGKEGEITLTDKVLFYRPAVELETVYKNGRGNIRYAYLDGFGILSEQVQGLKLRVENKY